MRKSSAEARKSQLTRALSIFAASQDGLERYKKPTWLKSDFGADLWIISNGRSGFVIDWGRLKLHFESVYRQQVLSIDWNVLKYWLASSTHWDALAAATDKSHSERLREVITCIDYLLLNHQRNGVVLNGIASLSLDDYAEFIDELSSSRSVHRSIYKWPTRVAEFFREEFRRHRKVNKRHSIGRTAPIELGELRQEEGYSDLTPAEAAFARAWLWDRGLYERGYGRDLYYFRPNLVALGQIVYPEILTPHKKLTMPPELCFMPRESSVREFLGSPVVTDDARMSRIRLDQHGAAFNTLRLLTGRLPDAPLVSSWPTASGLPGQCELKELGRYTLPSVEPMFYAFRSAVEFYLSHASHLMKSYLHLAKRAKKLGVSVSRLCGGDSIVAGVGEETAKMGVIRWSLNSDRYDLAADKDEYFRRLRTNEALWELMCVLMGAAQFIVGTLSARRITELCELEVGDCIDRQKQRILVLRRKRLSFGVRQRISRPIPDFAIRVIEEISDFQRKLAKIHGMETRHVFDRVTRQGAKPLRPCTDNCFNSSLDAFYDYIEMPLDELNRRYYLRQHQLRRFFAVAFFWNNSFKGLDAIRSFLGHATAKETYRYISEAVPAEIMSAVKKQWLSDHIEEQIGAHEEIANLVMKRFGTNDFNLIGGNAMNEFISTRIDSGQIKVEPVFLKGRVNYRIAVFVRELNE